MIEQQPKKKKEERESKREPNKSLYREKIRRRGSIKLWVPLQRQELNGRPPQRMDVRTECEGTPVPSPRKMVKIELRKKNRLYNEYLHTMKADNG